MAKLYAYYASFRFDMHWTWNSLHQTGEVAGLVSSSPVLMIAIRFIDEIRKAIPEEVFQHRPALALAVLARDIILIFILGSAMSTAHQMSVDFKWQHSDNEDSLLWALSLLLVLAVWLV